MYTVIVHNRTIIALWTVLELIKRVDATFTQFAWHRLRGTHTAGKKVSLFRIADQAYVCAEAVRFGAVSIKNHGLAALNASRLLKNVGAAEPDGKCGSTLGNFSLALD